MGQGTATAEAKRVAAFVGRLRELSWIEGRTVTIEYRWTEGRSDLAADIAGDFARRRIDIIVTSGTPLIAAAKQATTSIPIVFTAAGDPVGSGLVASLSRPGGNVTGLSVQATDLAGKRLDLLRQLVPGLRRVAIMGNVDNPVIIQELTEYQAAGRLSRPPRNYLGNSASTGYRARHRCTQRRHGRTLCLSRLAHVQQLEPHQHLDTGSAPADDAGLSGKH
jgi:putative tryptophan/tyrosine transport system substrate-binding protein